MVGGMGWADRTFWCARRMRDWAVVAVVAGACLAGAWPGTASGCYAVVVGRDASTDGAVLLGHNEQSGANRVNNLRVIPAARHSADSVVHLRRGGTLPQVVQTHRVIWSNLPDQEFSDNYMNQWGVAVVSDGCPSVEDGYDALVARGQIRDGGIGFMLRRLIALRARTAEEGVELAGALLERLGYTDTGRTLVIADPREAWLLSVVRGRQWVAQRVPDDGVVILPNVHVVAAVDLADSANFRGSPDLLEYATLRGWYDPRGGKRFSFRSVHNGSDPRDDRQWRGQTLAAEATSQWPPEQALPFAVRPDHKLSVRDVAAILRDHGAGPPTLCTAVTEEGAVFQLRSWLPPEIGAVYWRTSAEPCMGVLVPWYAGITATPESYHEPMGLARQLSLSSQFEQRAAAYVPNADLAWWVFTELRDRVHSDYVSRMAQVGPMARAFEDSLFARQPEVEAHAMALYGAGPEQAQAFLTRYSGYTGLRAVALARQMTAALRLDEAASGPAPGATE
jgi:dipeptidase